jgi:peptidoglycan/xylan/chitin deacetylase (PgdA/CDA1 family)
MPADPMPRYRPTPTVTVCLLLHAVALVGAVLQPAQWPLWLALLALAQVILTGCGLLPRCTLLGPNLNRLPATAAQRREVALTIDDGPDPEVTPQVLEQLAAAGARATFFCIGWRARQHPELLRAIVAAGHQVENHGDGHSNAFAMYGPRRIEADIRAGNATLATLAGHPPRFFRPTAGLRNPFLEPVLHRLGMRLASWTRRAYDTRCGNADTVYHRLTDGLDAGDILLLHDGHAARTTDGQPVILAVLPRLLATLNERQLKPVTLDAALQ